MVTSSLGFGHIGLGVALVCAVVYLVTLARTLRVERKNIRTCGYVAPRPTLAATLRVKNIFKWLIWLQVGKVRITGAENVDKVDGPKILSANHPHWADVGIMPLLVKGTGRYMAHGRVMSFAWGLPGVMLSRAGVFVANDDIRDSGKRTRAAATEMLGNGETMVIMPEGLTNFSPEVQPFREGTVKIARGAALKLGKPVHIVPSYLRYGKYPGIWLSKLDRAVQYFVVLLLFPLYRRKAHLVVGEPWSTADMVCPQTGRQLTDAEASEVLRQKIIALDPVRV